MTGMTALDTKAEAEVEFVLSKLVENWNRHDMTALASYFTEDADFVNVLGARIQGRPKIESQHIRLHRTIFRNSVLRLISTKVRLVRDDVAIAHAHWEMQGADQVPGWNVPEIRHGIFSYTLVLEKDGWRITSAHNTDTVPLAMP